MVADHGQCFLRERTLVPEDVVKVLKDQVNNDRSYLV